MLILKYASRGENILYSKADSSKRETPAFVLAEIRPKEAGIRD
jgi:hypothetical protein